MAENKIPRFVKLIDNYGVGGKVDCMCSDFKSKKGVVLDTSKDKPWIHKEWTYKLEDYMNGTINNYEECLPEKWYIEITDENRERLNEWRLKQPDCSYIDQEIHGYLVSKHQTDDSYYYNNVISEEEFYSDYINITFEEFERLALNKLIVEIETKSTGKLAFKGFKFDLKCRDVQFGIGITHKLPNLGRKPNLCSSEGFHYCNKLKDVFDHYYNGSTHRFCIVEILDEFYEDESKGITYSFRIIRELTREEVDNYLNADKLLDVEYENYEHKKDQRDKAEMEIRRSFDNQLAIDKAVKEKLAKIEQEKQDKIKDNTAQIAKNMRLDLVRKFQEKYPHTHICGSVGLFLHGIELDRFKHKINDFDIITPYYTKFEDLNSDTSSVNIGLFEDRESYKSGCDFGECISIGGIKADIRIDNQQKYDMIEFEGFRYKVSVLESIWEAKLRYKAKKHNDDLREAMYLS